MNKEYIEREAALKIIYDKWFTTCSRISNSIRELAAADVVPVVHGEWIALDRTEMFTELKCSHCGHLMLTGANSLYPNYCPNCGAKMDGGKE